MEQSLKRNKKISFSNAPGEHYVSKTMNIDRKSITLEPLEKELFNIDNIRFHLEISDLKLFCFYLKEIYKDLIERSESDKNLGISKVTFYEYMNLPLFLGEKLFYVLDRDNDGYLNLKDFVEGFNVLYFGTFKQTAKFVFNMYDFDKDGYLKKEDVKVLFSYLPLKNIDQQNEGFIEIDQILSRIKFEKFYDFEKFLRSIKNESSELYLQVICFLYENVPFSVKNVEYFKTFPKYIDAIKYNKETNLDKINTPTLIYKKENDVEIASPSKTSKFTPTQNLVLIETFNLEEDEDIEDNITNSYEKDKIVIPDTLTKSKDKNKKKNEKECISLKEITQNTQGIRKFNNIKHNLQTPSKYLLAQTEEIESLDLNSENKESKSRKSSN